MKRINILIAISFLFSTLLPSCEKNAGVDTVGNGSTTGGGGGTGVGRNWETHKLAYYNSSVVKISFAELTMEEEQAAIANNTKFNILYDTKAGPDAAPFLKVLSVPASTGGLWRDVAIRFNDPQKQKQFYSEAEVLAAAAGEKPLITLVVTDEIFEIVPE